MEAELRANLEQLAKLYAEAMGLKLATVAQKALGDWRFFERLDEQERASFTVRKYDAAVAWFAARWPNAVEWPKEIARPVSAGAVE